jgi:hypothetical protein
VAGRAAVTGVAEATAVPPSTASGLQPHGARRLPPPFPAAPYTKAPAPPPTCCLARCSPMKATAAATSPAQKRSARADSIFLYPISLSVAMESGDTWVGGWVGGWWWCGGVGGVRGAAHTFIWRARHTEIEGGSPERPITMPLGVPKPCTAHTCRRCQRSFAARRWCAAAARSPQWKATTPSIASRRTYLHGMVQGEGIRAHSHFSTTTRGFHQYAACLQAEGGANCFPHKLMQASGALAPSFAPHSYCPRARGSLWREAPVQHPQPLKVGPVRARQHRAGACEALGAHAQAADVLQQEAAPGAGVEWPGEASCHHHGFANTAAPGSNVCV